MKYSRIGFAVLCSIVLAGDAACAAAAQGTDDATPTRHVDRLRWMVGGLWVADASKLPGGLARIETRYDSGAGGAVIRFTTDFLDSKHVIKNSYAGNLYFDPSAKRLTMWYIDAQDTITQGQITIDGDNWSVDFRAPGEAVGKKQAMHLRCDIVRRRANAYEWTLSAWADSSSAWKKIFDLEYVRP